MQLGVYTMTGIKSDVLSELERRIEKEKVRFKQLCDEVQIHVGQGNPDEYGRVTQLHRPAPINDTTSAELLDLVMEHAREQLAHVPDEAGKLDENLCSVSFNITIHRPNPK